MQKNCFAFLNYFDDGQVAELHAFIELLHVESRNHCAFDKVKPFDHVDADKVDNAMVHHSDLLPELHLVPLSFILDSKIMLEFKEGNGNMILNRSNEVFEADYRGVFRFSGI